MFTLRCTRAALALPTCICSARFQPTTSHSSHTSIRTLESATGTSLATIKSPHAKHILLTLVGSDAESFVKEWKSFGMNSSTDVIALALVDNQLPDLGTAADGVYGVFGYFNGLQSAQNQSFLQAYS